MIPIDLIDEPQNAMRAEISEEYIRELADSISENGLLNPIAVIPNGKRYTVVAGHCRLLAHKSLARQVVECKVLDCDAMQVETLKCAENLQRADVNDGDIGFYLHGLVKDQGFSMDDLKRITRKSEAWINDRYLLIEGDGNVLAAVRAGRLGIGHARELNRCKSDDYRRLFLEQAVEFGATIPYLRQSVNNANMQGDGPVQAAPMPAPGEPAQDVAPPAMACVLCGGHLDTWNLQMVWIHKHELVQLLQAYQSAAQA